MAGETTSTTPGTTSSTTRKVSVSGRGTAVVVSSVSATRVGSANPIRAPGAAAFNGAASRRSTAPPYATAGAGPTHTMSGTEGVLTSASKASKATRLNSSHV